MGYGTKTQRWGRIAAGLRACHARTALVGLTRGARLTEACRDEER